MERDDKIVENQWSSNANETEVEETDNPKQEEEEEEALSLCDLPIKEENIKSSKETPQENKSIQDEFDFCSFSKESEMCSADQVFFQGKILPLRHSVSSESGLLSSRTNSTTSNRCHSRSESIGTTFYSTGFSSGQSSRSSSIRSHQSSTSTGSSSGYGGGSSRTTPIYKPRIPNNFKSHSSPIPQMKFSRIKNQGMPNCSQKSTMWSVFRLGLMTTPEIVLEDLKHRSNNNPNKKIQKSKSSFGKSEKKKKQGIFEVNSGIFSTCKCSSNAVDTIPSKVGTIKRIVRTKDELTHEELKETEHEQEGKQLISKHRTFEWLKQLSLDSTSSLKNN